MEVHVRWAAWLRIVWSALGLLLILAGLLFFLSAGMPLVREITQSMLQQQNSASTPANPPLDVNVDDLAELVRRSVTIMFVVVALLEILPLATGWAMLSYRPWARPVNIVISIFDLFSIPVGTALGAYSLWVMFQPETVRLFKSSRPPERDVAPL
jgi:hypothetical protein